MLVNLLEQRKKTMSDVHAIDREMWEILRKYKNEFIKRYSKHYNNTEKAKRMYKILKLRLHEKKTLKEVGKELGVTIERARQMEYKGIYWLDGVINHPENI